MFSILPAIALIILYFIFNKQNQGWRSSILPAAIIWGLIITASTEILSLLNLLNFVFILIIWSCVDIALGLILLRIIKTNQNSLKTSFFLELPNFLRFLLYGIGFVIAAVGIIAIIAPPNNWDSMDYHMSRVVHWIQNKNVAHYPTSYTPQLYQEPWAEFAIMHFQILSGGDYFANLLQWFSMIGSVLGTSLIAKQLGASVRGQVFSAVVTVSIPMGILQASSTQNDYVLAFWIVCFAYYVLGAVQKGKNTTWSHYCLLGSSLGLAILTKGTAYFYVFPFLFWVGLLQTRRLKWQVCKPILIVGIIAISINLCHWLRNYNLFGSPLGEPNDYRNEVLGINILISNILRNLSLHIGTPIGIFNGKANKLIQVIHTYLGLSVNDPRTTFTTTSFFVPGGWSTLGFPGNENSAGNLVHFLLIVLCLVILIYNQKTRKFGNIFGYLITIIGTFLFFCLLLKWQPWNSRLHLSFFVLFSPLIGLTLSRINSKIIVNYIAIFLILSTLPWVCLNRYRPLMGNNNIFQVSRIEQYFSNRPYLKDPYVGAIEFLNKNKCHNIGISSGKDPWEYPFWVLSHQTLGQQVQIQDINLANQSAITEKLYPFKDFEPCGIVYMQTKRSKQDKRENLYFKNQTFFKGWYSKDMAVFIKK